jgi:outer membrane lipoprotein LolB
MPSSVLRAAAALALLATLTACRTTAMLGPAAPWGARRPQLQALAHFDLKGRVAVAAGDNGFNAGLRWLQDGAHSQLTLQGPLGVGGVEISVTGDKLEIINARGEQLDRDAARAELARLGFEPPLTSLRYWVLGVPDPGQPGDETLDQAQQRLSALTQAGWHIDYDAYMAVGAQSLPMRLTLQRDTVRVRLLVNSWQL